MADLSQVPGDLQEHAKSMPKDLRDKIGQEELHYRLRHVVELTRNAARITNAEISRSITAQAKRTRDAMPYTEFSEELRRLRLGRDRAPSMDEWRAYCAAIRTLEHNHPMAPGVGAHLKRVKEYTPADESAADGKGAGAMLYKRATVDRLVQAELKKYEAKRTAEVERIRREIAELEAAAKTGRTTPLERARTTSKADELNAEADRLYKLADSLVGERDLARVYREKACEMKEEALRLRGTK